MLGTDRKRKYQDLASEIQSKDDGSDLKKFDFMYGHHYLVETDGRVALVEEEDFTVIELPAYITNKESAADYFKAQERAYLAGVEAGVEKNQNKLLEALGLPKKGRINSLLELDL